MSFLLPRLAPKSRNGTLVLRIGKEEIDFLFFRNRQNSAEVVSYGTEARAFFGVRQTLEKIFIHLPQNRTIQQLLVTFEAGEFRAQVVEQTLLPNSFPHFIDQAESISIERAVKRRAERIFNKNLFEESGILPREFALQRITIVERRINGYQVSKLRGFKSGEIEFSLLGVFLLESAFLPIEQFAKAHHIRNVQVLHMAEALESFAERKKHKGIYLCVEEEKTQIAIHTEERFQFSGIIPVGAHQFNELFSEALGMRESTAKVFADQYFHHELSLPVQEKLHIFLLPEIKKFGTLVKQKLLEAKVTLPEFVWVFGRGSALRDLESVFDQTMVEDLPFSQKPTIRFLLPKNVWLAQKFSGTTNPLYTLLCLMAAFVDHFK